MDCIVTLKAVAEGSVSGVSRYYTINTTQETLAPPRHPFNVHDNFRSGILFRFSAFKRVRLAVLTVPNSTLRSPRTLNGGKGGGRGFPGRVDCSCTLPTRQSRGVVL